MVPFMDSCCSGNRGVPAAVAKCESPHLLAARNFTTATGGNVSARMPDGSCWITPSRLHKARVRVEDLVRVDAEGTVLEGDNVPSSETAMHLAALRALPQAGAIIHAHPIAATGFAQAGLPIDTTSSSEAYVILGSQVPLLPYATPSTNQLAEMVFTALCERNQAYLLANHGVLTWGTDLWGAYDILDTLELFAQSLLASSTLGGARKLPDHELAVLDTKRVIL